MANKPEKIERRGPLAQLIDDKLCLSTRDMCAILGIDADTISIWAKQGCPKAKHGWWAVADVLRWKGLVGSGVKTEAEAEEFGAIQKKLHYEAELKEAQAEAAKIKNQIVNGELIKKTEIQDELDRFFSVFKKSLTSIPRKISMEVGPFTDGPTARRIEMQVSELINDALSQIAESGVYEAPRKKYIKG